MQRSRMAHRGRRVLGVPLAGTGRTHGRTASRRRVDVAESFSFALRPICAHNTHPNARPCYCHLYHTMANRPP